jgi:hypothetical protein
MTTAPKWSSRNVRCQSGNQPRKRCATCSDPLDLSRIVFFWMTIASPRNKLTPPAIRQPACAACGIDKKAIPTVRKTGETAQNSQNLPLEIPSYVICGVAGFIAFTRSRSTAELSRTRRKPSADEAPQQRISQGSRKQRGWRLAAQVLWLGNSILSRFQAGRPKNVTGFAKETVFASFLGVRLPAVLWQAASTLGTAIPPEYSMVQ